MIHLLVKINPIGKIHGNRLHSEVYLKPYQKSKMALVSKIIDGFLPLTISAKSFILEHDRQVF